MTENNAGVVFQKNEEPSTSDVKVVVDIIDTGVQEIFTALNELKIEESPASNSEEKNGEEQLSTTDDVTTDISCSKPAKNLTRKQMKFDPNTTNKLEDVPGLGVKLAAGLKNIGIKNVKELVSMFENVTEEEFKERLLKVPNLHTKTAEKIYGAFEEYFFKCVEHESNK